MKKRVITTTLAAGFILVFAAEAHADTINGHHVTRLSESRAVDDKGDRWSKDGNVWFNDETREYGKIVSDSLESIQGSSYYPELKEPDSDKPNELVQIQVQDEGTSVHQQMLTTVGTTESKSNQTNESTVESQTGMTVGATVEQPTTTDPTLGTTTIKKGAVPTTTEATQPEEDTRMAGTTKTRSNQTNESTIESQTGMTVGATVEQPTTTDPTLGTTTITKEAVPTTTEATQPEEDTRMAGTTKTRSNQTNESTIESQTGMTVEATVEQPTTTDPTLGTTTITKEAVPTTTEATQPEEDTRMAGTTKTRSNQTNESTIESQTGMTVEATVEQPTTTDPTLGTTTIKKGAVPTTTEATKSEEDTRIAETSGKGSNRTNGSTSKEKTKTDVVAKPVRFLSSAKKSVPMRAIKKDTAFSNILSKNNGHTFPKTGESTLFSNILQAVGFLVISVLGVVSIRVKKTKN
ncbi:MULTISPECIES: hypothetical protein [unclassified Enterococcus]|jgi:hypothetical protein|uniref:hypothetical protein n=4 Tax=Enterococcus TaxID=1350 RepID=UPI0010E2546F|nr:Uncharacterised protein [Enterococcus casseliflavus]